jgi:hypothetical protein
VREADIREGIEEECFDENREVGMSVEAVY